MDTETKEEYRKSIPCYECLIKATCTRSFINGTACDDLWQFVHERFKKRIKECEEDDYVTEN